MGAVTPHLEANMCFPKDPPESTSRTELPQAPKAGVRPPARDPNSLEANWLRLCTSTAH